MSTATPYLPIRSHMHPPIAVYSRVCLHYFHHPQLAGGYSNSTQGGSAISLLLIVHQWPPVPQVRTNILIIIIQFTHNDRRIRFLWYLVQDLVHGFPLRVGHG